MWTNLLGGLRQDDIEEGLHLAKSQRNTRFPLPTVYPIDRDLHHICHIGGKMKREGNGSNHHTVQITPRQDYIIHDHQKDQYRKSFHHLNITAGHPIAHLEAAHPQPTDQEAEKRTEKGGDSNDYKRHNQSVIDQHIPPFGNDIVRETTLYAAPKRGVRAIGIQPVQTMIPAQSDGHCLGIGVGEIDLLPTGFGYIQTTITYIDRIGIDCLNKPIELDIVKLNRTFHISSKTHQQLVLKSGHLIIAIEAKDGDFVRRSHTNRSTLGIERNAVWYSVGAVVVKPVVVHLPEGSLQTYLFQKAIEGFPQFGIRSFLEHGHDRRRFQAVYHIKLRKFMLITKLFDIFHEDNIRPSVLQHGEHSGDVFGTVDIR